MSEMLASPTALHFYKVYDVDKAGRIKGSSLITALDDRHALRLAAEPNLTFEREVWDQSRYVGTVAPDGFDFGATIRHDSIASMETIVGA